MQFPCLQAARQMRIAVKTGAVTGQSATAIARNFILTATDREKVKTKTAVNHRTLHAEAKGRFAREDAMKASIAMKKEDIVNARMAITNVTVTG